MVLRAVAVLLAWVTFVGAQNPSTRSATCGPSLLQTGGTIDRKLHKVEPTEEPAEEVTEPPAPDGEKPKTPNGWTDPAIDQKPKKPKKELQGRGAMHSRWTSQFVLEVGVLLIMLLLGGAGLYLWVEHKLGGEGELGRSKWSRVGTFTRHRWAKTKWSRMTAWGAHVDNDVCDSVMVFSCSKSSKPASGLLPIAERAKSLRFDHVLSEVKSIPKVLGISSAEDERIVAGLDLAKKAFLGPLRHHFVPIEGLQERFHNAMTFEDYREAACNFLLTIFTSSTFGFAIDQFTNVDNDRLFWTLHLDEVATLQYAAHYRYPVALNAVPYAREGMAVPTNDSNDEIYAYYPYLPKYQALYKEMGQIDRLKLMRMRIDRYVNLEALLDQHVLLQHFAAHDLEAMTELETWSMMMRWFRFPKYSTIDKVKDYYGEQVAFMFLWQRFYLSALLVPAICGSAVFFRRFCLPDRAHSTVQMVFTVVMSVWATIFNARYVRFEARTRQRWGMVDFRSGHLDMQAGYDPKMLNTFKHNAIHALGDFAALSMMVLSILTTLAIQHFRAHHQDWLGPANGWYVDKGSAVLTAIQILTLDWIWQCLSYALVNRENHRLRSAWWESWIKRLLTVRVFTNLFPFVYVGFLKEHSPLGCPTSGHGCLDELQLNLLVYFGISMACNVARDLGLIAYARMQHAWEWHGRGTEEKVHMSIQVQATLCDYNDWVFIDDWTRQVTTFLLLVCFNVVLPVVGLFVLLITMFEARLLAHRICCHLQRPFPRGAQGIGTWQSVLDLMVILGVLMTTSFSIFVMPPLRLLPLSQKLTIFVATEHILLLLNIFVRTKFPKTPPDVSEVQEENDKMLMQNFIDPTLHSINVSSESIGGKMQRLVKQAVQNERAHTQSHTQLPAAASPSNASSSLDPHHTSSHPHLPFVAPANPSPLLDTFRETR